MSSAKTLTIENCQLDKINISTKAGGPIAALTFSCVLTSDVARLLGASWVYKTTGSGEVEQAEPQLKKTLLDYEIGSAQITLAPTGLKQTLTAKVSQVNTFQIVKQRKPSETGTNKPILLATFTARVHGAAEKFAHFHDLAGAAPGTLTIVPQEEAQRTLDDTLDKGSVETPKPASKKRAAKKAKKE